MSAQSIEQPYPIFTDADGDPLENGYIWIGVENLNPITDPVAVYWDEALTQPAVQPIRTAGGYPVNSGTPARLYTASSYSILAQDRNGITVYSAQSETALTNSDAVTFLQAGTGAVVRTAQSKMRETVSVKDFGAVGDGVADDRAAIQAAINYAQASSTVHCVEFPTGNYAINAPIIINGNFGFGLVIEGNKSTVTASHNGVAFDCNSAIPTPAPTFNIHLAINNLTIVGPGKANALAVGVKMYGASYSLNNVYITAFYLGLQGAGCLISEFNSCTLTGNTIGSNFTELTGFAPNDNHFYKCSWTYNDRAILFGDFPYGSVTLIGCQIEANNQSGNATDGVSVCNFSNAGEVTFINCHFETNPGEYNLLYDSAQNRHLTLIGCKVIPGDTCGNAVYMGYGQLVVDNSDIIQAVGQNLFLGVNNGGTVVIGDTNGSINGTLTKLITLKEGRVATGGVNIGASLAGVGAKGSAGIGAVVEGRLDFNNSAGTRLGYLNQNNIVLDASASYTVTTGTGAVIVTRVAGVGFGPGSDNAQSLGEAALRWSTVYAGTGTINTSDARSKQQTRDLSAAERAVALKCKGLLKAFKFNDAVQEKGERARIHFGVIAQDVEAAFAAEGLDASRYGLFCFDQWDDQYAECTDENGEPTGKQKLIVAAGNRYGIRYEQLLAFIISAL
jgi:hypothetical protein